MINPCDLKQGFFRVRSSHDFGQDLVFLALPCPKFAHLRTEPWFFGSPLSEVRSSLDRTFVYWLSCVRSSLIFRYDLGFLALRCPKFAHLRTGPRFFGSPLSEVRSSSDTTWFFWHSVVRSSLFFGHDLGFNALPCPKFARLRTRPGF